MRAADLLRLIAAQASRIGYYSLFEWLLFYDSVTHKICENERATAANGQAVNVRKIKKHVLLSFFRHYAMKQMFGVFKCIIMLYESGEFVSCA